MIHTKIDGATDGKMRRCGDWTGTQTTAVIVVREEQNLQWVRVESAISQIRTVANGLPIYLADNNIPKSNKTTTVDSYFSIDVAYKAKIVASTPSLLNMTNNDKIR
jgi:hypothetical protein